MEENFPEDTDEHVIQVVLAMINAVRGRLVSVVTVVMSHHDGHIHKLVV